VPAERFFPFISLFIRYTDYRRNKYETQGVCAVPDECVRQRLGEGQPGKAVAICDQA
jgi:hypothetical protein